jgi:hypothetical protein
VFEDNAFLHYRYQLRLMPADPTMPQVAIPYSRNGLFAWSVRDRVWEQWWKRTQAPPVPLHEAESGLQNWAEFYWGHSKYPMTVRIEARPQDVEMRRIDTALFSRNNSIAWRAIGNIRLGRGASASMSWLNPPKPGEEHLGDYLSRVLAEDSH